MVQKITFILKWIKVNTKVVLFAVGVGLVMAFCSYRLYKNRRIFSLEAKIAALSAQLELERVALKYNATIGDLKRMRLEDEEINKRLVEISSALLSRLPEDMSADEIVSKFKEIGL